MSTLKIMEIKELASEDIDAQVKKSRIDLVTLRMKLASRQLEDPSLISKKRVEIARLLTIQTQKNNPLKNDENQESKPVSKSKVKADLKSTSTKTKKVTKAEGKVVTPKATKKKSVKKEKESNA